MSTNQKITDFANLPSYVKVKYNAFNSIRFDLSLLDAATKTFMSDPDPDFICCLSSKLSSFMQSEIIPLINHEHDKETEND